MWFGEQNPKGVLSDDILPDGTVVKKGGLVTYVPYAMGRMTDLWGPDAQEFRPERWLKDGVFVPASPYKFTAFQVRQHMAFFLSSGPI
jgi:cytochrome P450